MSVPRARTAAAPAAAAEHDAAARVLRRFRVVFNAVKTHFQQVEKAAGIGGAQLWALSLVQAQPGLGVGELARAMDVHQTTASNLVKSLTSAGLVTAERSDADRRAVKLRALPAGRRVLKRAPGPFAGVLPQALGRLDAAVLKRLEADLGRLIAELQPAEGRPSTRAARTPLAHM